jgi:hypothetical protein
MDVKKSWDKTSKNLVPLKEPALRKTNEVWTLSPVGCGSSRLLPHPHPHVHLTLAVAFLPYSPLPNTSPQGTKCNRQVGKNIKKEKEKKIIKFVEGIRGVD